MASYEADEWQSLAKHKAEMSKYQEYASATFKKDKPKFENEDEYLEVTQDDLDRAIFRQGMKQGEKQRLTAAISPARPVSL